MKSKLYSYTLVTLQCVCILFLVMQPNSIWTQPLPLVVFLWGASIGIYAISHNPRDNFNIIPEIKENAELITKGAYAYVRHPMYFSVLVMMLGFLVASFSFLTLFFYAILILSLFLKASKEEALWMQKSNEYQTYRAKTKSIIPFIL